MNEIHNNKPKTSPLPAAAGLYMYRTRSIWNIHSIALLAVCIERLPDRKMGDDVNLGDIFFIFFHFSRPKCSLAML
jgi:hypothetical protein